MAKRIIAWQKTYNYEVPYNPMLQGNTSVDIFEVDESFDPVAYRDKRINSVTPAVEEDTDTEESLTEVVDPTIMLVKAIGDLSKDNQGDYTALGLPNAIRLSELTGMRVTTKMRDEAWAIFQKEQ